MNIKKRHKRTVKIICPIYNGEKYIRDLNQSITNQKVDNDYKVNVKYILTESIDKSEQILDDLELDYYKILKREYSHSLTRESAALGIDEDILIFISQDIVINNETWLINLINPIIKGECEASFSRQICNDNSIEKYTRESNYPSKSRLVCKKDIEKLGLMTFFYSDASSAISSRIFSELNGYDGKWLIINEDMYLAEKIISNGYRIKYCANSEVIHCHTFTLKQLFNRYFDTGVFLAQNNQFDKYKANSSGIKMFNKVLFGCIKDKNYKVLLRIIPDFVARLLGSSLGKRYEILSYNMKKVCSLDKNFWDK